MRLQCPRLDTLQAAVLSAKLLRLDRWNACRRELARSYCELLAGSGTCFPPKATKPNPVITSTSSEAAVVTCCVTPSLVTPLIAVFTIRCPSICNPPFANMVIGRAISRTAKRLLTRHCRSRCIRILASSTWYAWSKHCIKD
ncbi:MAG: DegT/DnrJ/EryC1/StrS family aminotransferase [Deltaproteobacteria bacterium]|nr:DegT/DnrJ/EryC1/StrS family aminotransferase [Deltaproteobacteria bacterium]